MNIKKRKVGKPTAEEIAAAAYSQFGIVAGDEEIVAFANWLLNQYGLQLSLPIAEAA